MSARDDHAARVMAGVSEPMCWAALFDEVDQLRTRVDAVSAVLAEDYHPDKSDGWWDGYTELHGRIADIIKR